MFFLTYPANADRERWLERHRVIPRLYRIAVALGLASALSFIGISTFAPALLVNGWVYPASAAVLSLLSTVSFPIKIGALLDTRRRAASPLVNQQTTVLLLGIGMGLGAWLCLMLWPLQQLYQSPFDPQVGSALMLLYPAAIGYATVRYRLFDATVVIRRSVIYTGLAGLITGAYALLLAGTNALLAQTDLTRSPWFSAGFMFVVVLLFNPLRERVRRAVDRTFFRERHDYALAMRTLARSMSSLLDLDEITRRLTTTIESAMHVRSTRLLVDGFPHDILAALEVAPGALSRYQLAADPSFGSDRGAALAAYQALDAEVVVPLRFQGGLRALLVLGGKRSEAPYTGEDLEMLEALADQAAVAVANAEAHRQVLDYAQQLERSLLIRGSLAKFVPRRVRQLIEESPEAPSLEKKETDVSVLFADISGYTRLSSRLQPDDLAGLVERYFGAFLDEIVKHGGDVNETAGDGLMVIFHEGAARPRGGGRGAGHPSPRRRDRRRAGRALRAGGHARGCEHRPRAPGRDQDRGQRGHALDLHRLGHDHQHRGAPGRAGGRRGDRHQRGDADAAGGRPSGRGPGRARAEERGDADAAVPAAVD